MLKNLDENKKELNDKKDLIEEKKIEKEEETLVLIQFTDLDDANYCEQFSNKFKSIDISNKNPIIQIGNRLYSGEYQNNIGTYLYFEENKLNTNNTSHNNNSIVNSNQDSNNSFIETQNKSTQPQQSAVNYNYFGKSYKKLVLNRLFVEEKELN